MTEGSVALLPQEDGGGYLPIPQSEKIYGPGQLADELADRYADALIAKAATRDTGVPPSPDWVV